MAGSKSPVRLDGKERKGVGRRPDLPTGVIVSPLATLAFKLFVVGDTGLKTGWVRCRHGAGKSGTGRCGVGLGGVVTYFADRICTILQIFPLSPGNRVCLSVSVCVSIHFYICAFCTHFTAKYSENAFALIYVQKVQNMAKVRFDGAYRVCGVRVASAIRSVIKDAIKKCSSKCYSIFYDNTAVHELLCHRIRIVLT